MGQKQQQELTRFQSISPQEKRKKEGQGFRPFWETVFVEDRNHMIDKAPSFGGLLTRPEQVLTAHATNNRRKRGSHSKRRVVARRQRSVSFLSGNGITQHNCLEKWLSQSTTGLGACRRETRPQ